MATTDNTTTAPTLPAGFDLASAVRPTINFISQQITASLPSQYAAAVTAQFAGAPTIGSVVPSTSPPTFSNSQDASAALGAALARPSIAFIQAQITSLVPSEYAAAITSQFAAAPPSFSPGAAPVPSTAGASTQFPMITAGLREYLLALNTSTT